MQIALPFDRSDRGRAPSDPSRANPSLPPHGDANRAKPQSVAPQPVPTADQPVFVRHPRARRYVLRVAEDGTVRVTIPRWGSKREAAEFARSESGWIAKQRTRLQKDGARQDTAPADPAFERELRLRARTELPRRLAELAALHGFAPGAVTKVSVRNQKWRWGSCSPNGHICLNWRLAGMPDAVRDYVLVHELMHLRRMDHSPKFWKLVAQACPDYRALRRYLRSVAR
jgi:predicted metal-dependent hydrolase